MGAESTKYLNPDLVTELQTAFTNSKQLEICMSEGRKLYEMFTNEMKNYRFIIEKQQDEIKNIQYQFLAYKEETERELGIKKNLSMADKMSLMKCNDAINNCSAQLNNCSKAFEQSTAKIKDLEYNAIKNEKQQDDTANQLKEITLRLKLCNDQLVKCKSDQNKYGEEKKEDFSNMKKEFNNAFYKEETLDSIISDVEKIGLYEEVINDPYGNKIYRKKYKQLDKSTSNKIKLIIHPDHCIQEHIKKKIDDLINIKTDNTVLQPIIEILRRFRANIHGKNLEYKKKACAQMFMAFGKILS